MYISNNKYVVLIEDVKTVVLDQVGFKEKLYDVVAVHYKDGSITQMPYDTYEEAQKGFAQIVEYLVE
jgi:hypothetical protein